MTAFSGAREAFRSAIAATGITPPADVIPDGKIHRFASNGERGDDAGWYVLHAGIRVDASNRLIVPVIIDDELTSLQFIAADGSKRFLEGGRVASGFFVIGNAYGAETLLIAEGYATAASLHEAMGLPVVVAFNAGNLSAAAQAIRAKYPTARLIICADHDVSNVGQSKAKEAADMVNGLVAIPPTPGMDFNDLAAAQSADAVRTCVENAVENEAELDRLAKLSPLEYDKVRKANAKRLGVRTDTLDQEIRSRRPRTDDDAAPGSPLTLLSIEPWPEAVDGQALLGELVAVIRRHVRLPIYAADAVALWVVWSWLIDAFDIAPRLVLLSPEKRCGKTTLLELLVSVAHRALLASGISPSAIFRTIDAAKPTLLIDEADTFVNENEELRGILNSGHTRAASRVIRCVGEDHEPRTFSTWCPMVLAAIGVLPGTVEDRSIIISMQRKAPGETVMPFPRSGKHAAALRSELHDLARKVRRWAEDHGDELADREPTVPNELHDRAADNWRPLLAIADEIGGDWPTNARAAATKLSGGMSVTVSRLKSNCWAISEVSLRKTPGTGSGQKHSAMPSSQWRNGLGRSGRKGSQSTGII